MARDAAQTVVLTTSAPGVAWFALLTAGIEAHRAALVTRPGVAIDAGDPSLARELCAALALTGARQIAVVGYAEDTVYSLGAQGLANLTRKAGGDPGCFVVAGQTVLPGLKRDAAATVQRTVQKLAGAAWLPPGTVVIGVVVARDGSSDNVALHVVGEADGTPRDRVEESAVEEEPWEPNPLLMGEERDGEAPWPTVGVELGTDIEEAFFAEPVAPMLVPVGAAPAGGPTPPATISSGPGPSGRLTGGPLAGGVSASGGVDQEGPLAGGPISGGPVSAGPAESGGPVPIGALSGGALSGGPISGGGPLSGGPISSGPMSGGPISSSPMSDGPVSRGPISGGPILGGTLSGGPMLSEGGERGASEIIPEITATPQREDGGLLDDWLTRDPGRTVADLETPGMPRGKDDLGRRVGDAGDQLHTFLRSRTFKPPIDRDVRQLLHDGASPEAIMRHLKILVTQFGAERADVRAAFGTLEMAQTLLTRDQLTDELRRILR